MIEARGVEVVFHRGEALETPGLRGVDLQIGAGEFAAVIGSNGAGKSTLLNVLAGDIAPTAGGVFMDGKNITAQPAHIRASRIARVFQDPLAGTCAGLTVEENMSLAQSRGKTRGWRRAVSDARRKFFRRRLQDLGLNLENRLGEKVGQLSGGQRQAVSLVMATLAESGVLLLDEHTAALDPRMAEFVLELTRRIASEYGLAALMVTHSMKAALSCGGRTIMLHRGKIILDASGEERSKMQTADLLRLFAQTSGGEIDNDRLLLE
ncbi:MAG: ABC transporter ATP-binding protein [Gammaproteobacteria bacterium]